MGCGSLRIKELKDPRLVLFRRRGGISIASGSGINSPHVRNASHGVSALELDRAAGAQTARTFCRMLFAVVEAADVLLPVELDAELFDKLQLCFQKIDVFFLID